MEAALEEFLHSNNLGTFLLDEETQALLQEVQYVRREARQAEDSVTEAEQAVQTDKKHLGHLRNVLAQIQSLSEAHQLQIETESEAERGLLREVSSLQQRCLQLEQQVVQVQEDAERLHHLQHEKEREVERLQRQVVDDSELVEGLLDQLVRQEQRSQLLLQYSAADNAEIKEALVCLERTCSEAAQAEAALEAARHQQAAECTVQAVLASSYASACRRRDALLLQWEEGLLRLQEKGEQHAACLQAILQLQDRIRAAVQSGEQEAALLQQVQESCGLLQRRLDMDLNTASQAYLQILETEKTKMEIDAQVAGLKTGIKKTEQEEFQLQVEVKEDREANEEKLSQLESLQIQIEKAEQKVDLNSELLENTQATVKDLEAMIEVNNRLLQDVIQQRERACQRHQRHEAEVSRLAEQEKVVTGEVAALKAHAARTAKETKAVTASIIKLNELCYGQESELETLKKRLHDLTHDDNNNEETKDKQQQVATLMEATTCTSVAVRMLQRHLSALQSQVTTGSVELCRQQRHLVLVQQELLAARMSCVSTDREKLCLLEQREMAEVRRSLQLVQLQQRRKLVQAAREAALELTSSRLQMEQLAGEQCSAVRAQLRAQEAEQRAVEVELHEASLQLHRVTTRLSQLKERYASLRTSLGAEKDEETEVTAARAIMKMEEEVSGLQEAGDLAEEAVREAEGDLEALALLLDHARTEEHQLRRRLHLTLTSGIEDEPRLKLEEETMQLEVEIREMESHKAEAVQLLKSFKDRLHELELQVRAVEDLLAEKGVHVRSVERELADQKIKMTHAKEAIGSLHKRTRQHSDMHTDIELRVMQDRLRLVNQHLGRLANEHPHLAPSIVLYCQQAHIPPPKLSAITHSAAYGSRSSVGSLASSRSSEGRASPDLGARRRNVSSRASHSSCAGSLDSGSGSVVHSPRGGADELGSSQTGAKNAALQSSREERPNDVRTSLGSSHRGSEVFPDELGPASIPSGRQRKIVSRENMSSAKDITTTDSKSRKGGEGMGLTFINAEFPRADRSSATFKGRSFKQRPARYP